LIAIFISMRACTTALVARVSAVCLDRDAIVCTIQVFFLGRELTQCCKLSRTLTLMTILFDNQTVCR
jgi:hypothetical protein